MHIMSLKVKNTYNKKQKELSEFSLREKKIDEKENKYSNLRSKKKKHFKELVESQCEEEKLKELPESISSPGNRNPGMKVKTLGFWCKKLQTLEESKNKNKECGLYDFNESDESDFLYERKKKVKQKVGLLRRKQPTVAKCNKQAEKMDKVSKPEKKMKKIHRHSLCREQIILNKERKKLAEKGKKFTFSAEMPSLGITSTPAVNKDNLVGASNFLFLSPIIKEDNKNISSINQSLPLDEKIIDDDLLITHKSQETPKVETKLKRISCRRILRSGKMLNT